MLKAVKLPASVAHLDSSLSNVHGDTFPHRGGFWVLVWSAIDKYLSSVYIQAWFKLTTAVLQAFDSNYG